MASNYLDLLYSTSSTTFSLLTLHYVRGAAREEHRFYFYFFLRIKCPTMPNDDAGTELNLNQSREVRER